MNFYFIVANNEKMQIEHSGNSLSDALKDVERMNSENIDSVLYVTDEDNKKIYEFKVNDVRNA